MVAIRPEVRFIGQKGEFMIDLSVFLATFSLSRNVF